jgi:hypothetical protein
MESAATECKRRGNEAFGQQHYEEALQQYTEGIQILQSSEEELEAMDPTATLLWILLHANRALVQLERHDYLLAERDCSTILEGPLGSDASLHCWKLWYRRALAREQLALRQCSSLESPDCPDGNLARAETYIQQAQEDLQRCQNCIERMPVNSGEFDAGDNKFLLFKSGYLNPGGKFPTRHRLVRRYDPRSKSNGKMCYVYWNYVIDCTQGKLIFWSIGSGGVNGVNTFSCSILSTPTLVTQRTPQRRVWNWKALVSNLRNEYPEDPDHGEEE